MSLFGQAAGILHIAITAPQEIASTAGAINDMVHAVPSGGQISDALSMFTDKAERLLGDLRAVMERRGVKDVEALTSDVLSIVGLHQVDAAKGVSV